MAISTTETNALRPLNRVLLGAALILLLFHFVVYIVYAANLVAFPFDYDQGEGFELVDTIMFSRGEWPYRDTNIYPFYSSNYPPLLHVLAAPFVWVFGPAYWYGRLLGFLGTLLTAAAISYAVYRDGQHKLIALLSGLAFLASNTIYHIGPLFRQHMTMVLFETLAVVFLAHANEIADKSKRRRTLLLGLGLVIAAGYTKQLAYATASAVGVFLLLRQPRRALVWGAGAAAVGVGIFLWINIATSGQWWLQTISANINDYIPDQIFGLFRLWFGLHGFLIVPALLYAAYELYFSRLSLYTLWFVVATANSVTAGKWGAGDSYFATAIAAMCILSGLFAARCLRGEWRFPATYLTRAAAALFGRFLRGDLWKRALSGAALIVIPLLYIGYGRATLHMPTDGFFFGALAQVLQITPNADNGFYDSAGRIAGGYADIGHLTTEADIAAGWHIVDLLRAVDGPVLSEEAAFNLWAGHDVVTNPTQLLNLANNGLFDDRALVAMIENQEFDLIVLRAQFYPVPVLVAIDTHYARSETVRMNGFEYMILRPR
ncbi:MAG: phospholipid carrier-dependent glycosyltransferase [Chloroflexi bacterium]|nr:phospholipid carrier-dependent glycosyltransferase [Chloroflexota bacterium]